MQHSTPVTAVCKVHTRRRDVGHYRRASCLQLPFLRLIGALLATACGNSDSGGETALADTLDNEIFRGVTASERVIFERISGGQIDIFAVNLDGSGELPIANTADNENFGGILQAPARQA